MFISRWIIAVALGLSLPNLLQAQNQQEQTNQSPAIEQSQTDDPVFSFPVELIESQEAAEARERRERESTQREIDDLIAQQGMNAATQAMNEATQSMKNSAWVSTGLVGLGTILLVWTLFLTRQANRAATEAVAITRTMGIAEHRPYVDLEVRPPISHWSIDDPSIIFWRLMVVINNSGNTPAHRLRMRSCWRLTDMDQGYEFPEGVAEVHHDIRGGQSVGVLEIKILASDLAQVQRLEKQLVIWADISYETDLDKSVVYRTKSCIKVRDIAGDPGVYFDPEVPVSIKWENVPEQTCYDNECVN